MADDARNGAGTNARPLNDTISGSAPGIPDDALLPGQEPPTPDDEDEVARTKAKLDELGGSRSAP